MPYFVHRFWTIDETQAFLSISTIQKSESEFLQKNRKRFMLPCMVFSEPQCNGAPEHAAWSKMGRICPPRDTLTNGPHNARCVQSQKAINKSKGPQKGPQRHSPSPSPSPSPSSPAPSPTHPHLHPVDLYLFFTYFVPLTNLCNLMRTAIAKPLLMHLYHGKTLIMATVEPQGNNHFGFRIN